MNHQNIIENGFAYLKNELENAIEWGGLEIKQNGLYADAVFIVNGKKLYVETKNEVRPVQVEQFAYRKNHFGNLLVIANYITPNAKELLKERGINYIDEQGNIWLKFNPVYIHIEGIPKQNTPKHKKNRAFTKTGIKVVFQLLVDNELVNTTYRNIAEKAEVALGTITRVIEGLKEEGFLVKKNKDQWIITNYTELLNRWQEEYTKRLKPTLFIKRYRPTDENFHVNWKKLQLQHDTVWAGEPAADLLTNYLNPEQYTLYTHQHQQDIIKTYRWIPDDEGEIYIYKKFWNTPLDEKNIAPALLVYAELMDTKDSRCIETATRIYEQHLQKP
ncbi:MAG TPA: type IV toxin-antitoxin system AbiEi family antitoxin [Vicingaceae bacterium]